ncbi:MAG: acetoacetate decarboxylase [Alphaproteobacteria bacterium HGW-Alphaproteobacteria-4]|jgi:acetoacetate decarboxylase|nr:MAG: acetoacetate decarboxylase [Alphaproteobacteria bacterium HGW-Alphaproteobacteria-4]
MTPAEILSLAAMPPANPSYPRGPYRFLGREYLVITYETDPDAIRRLVPEPLVPDGSNQVHYEWIAMPDSTGFGSYQESGVVIPCLLNGEPVNYTAMMFLNDEPPISAGREIWGFPKRWGEPKLEVRTDTLTGTLHYGGERVAMGTMTYKYEDRMAPNPADRGRHLMKTSVNLKLIPCVTGGLRIAELVAFNLTDIQMHFHFSGPARLHLIPHINAPVADLPVLRVVEGRHFKADLTLPYGRIVHNYLA